MTQRNQECKVQVQALRVSARIAALAALALALALTPYPATPSDREGPRPTRATDDLQPAVDSKWRRKRERSVVPTGSYRRAMSPQSSPFQSELSATDGKNGDCRPTESENTYDGKNATYTRGSNANLH